MRWNSGYAYLSFCYLLRNQKPSSHLVVVAFTEQRTLGQEHYDNSTMQKKHTGWRRRTDFLLDRETWFVEGDDAEDQLLYFCRTSPALYNRQLDERCLFKDIETNLLIRGSSDCCSVVSSTTVVDATVYVDVPKGAVVWEMILDSVVDIWLSIGRGAAKTVLQVKATIKRRLRWYNMVKKMSSLIRAIRWKSELFVEDKLICGSGGCSPQALPLDPFIRPTRQCKEPRINKRHFI